MVPTVWFYSVLLLISVPQDVLQGTSQCRYNVHVHVSCEAVMCVSCAEFEGLYWEEQKRLKEQRVLDNKRMVSG